MGKERKGMWAEQSPVAYRASGLSDWIFGIPSLSVTQFTHVTNQLINF